MECCNCFVCFVDRCLSFCTFSFGHCVVCSSSIYGFWFPLWYLQTLLNYKKYCKRLWQYLQCIERESTVYTRKSTAYKQQMIIIFLLCHIKQFLFCYVYFYYNFLSIVASPQHAALRSKSKYQLAGNQDNMSEWSDMSTQGLLFQWTSTINIPLSLLV